MRRFLTSLTGSLALAIMLLSPAASADTRYWQLDMYQPTGTSTAHTINVEYKVLSTVQSDRFTVTLYENGVAQEALSQTTTKDYGDSGVFQVLLDDGTYTFHVAATDLGDASTKSTEDQTVTVTSPPSGGTTVVYVNNPATTGGRGGGTAGSGTGSTTVASASGSGTGSSAETGTVLGADTTGQSGSNPAGSSSGTINASGNSSTTKSGGKVLGVSTHHPKSQSNYWWAILLGILAVLAAAYYWLLSRRSRQP